jgi:hypothetical protein
VVGEVCAVGAKLTDGAAGPERHLNWPVALGIHGRKEERHTAGCFRCFFVAACCTGTAHLGEALGCTGRPLRWLEGAHGHRGEELAMQALTRWGVERALACGGGMQGMLAFKMTSRWVGGSRNSIVRGAV